jgi:hypothetical protein
MWHWIGFETGTLSLGFPGIKVRSQNRLRHRRLVSIVAAEQLVAVGCAKIGDC